MAAPFGAATGQPPHLLIHIRIAFAQYHATVSLPSCASCHRMTSISAELRMAGRIYPLAACTFGFHQNTDHRGRPNSKVVGGLLRLLLAGDEGPEITEWASLYNSLRSGEVRFFSDNAITPNRKLTFTDARCVSQHVQLVPGTEEAAYQCWIVLSAQELELDGQILQQHWHRPQGTQAVAATPVPHAADEPSAALAVQAAATTPATAPAAAPPSKEERYAARRYLMHQAKLALHFRKERGPVAKSVRAALTRLERNNVAVERARLSDHVYSTDQNPAVSPPEGWSVLNADELALIGVSPDMLLDTRTGLKAAVYQSSFEEPRKLVIAFAGTEDGPDCMSDVRQAFGIKDKQYNQAMILAKTISNSKHVGADGMETTGHSLGGGLAAAGSVTTGAKGYTFNAAGLHPRTVARSPYEASRPDMKAAGRQVQAYRSTADPINNVQNFLRGAVPRALGVDRPVVPAPQWQHRLRELVAWNPKKPAMAMILEGHGSMQMVDNIEQEIDQDVNTLNAYLAASAS